jgi:hypothetical protein
MSMNMLPSSARGYYESSEGNDTYPRSWQLIHSHLAQQTGVLVSGSKKGRRAISGE